jgi:HEAT repeat protein
VGYQKDPAIRTSSAEALGAIRDGRAAEALIGALSDPDWNVRMAAAASLGAIGGPRAVEPLIALLEDRAHHTFEHSFQRESVRETAAAALGALGDQRAIEPLGVALGYEGTDVHLRSVEALATIGGPRAAELLVGGLRDRTKSVRDVAAKALDGLDWTPHSADEAGAYWAARGKWNKCIKIGAPAVEPLILIVKDNYPALSADAMAALAAIGDPRAVEPLVEALREPPTWRHREFDDVPAAAAKALGELGAPAVEPLARVLLKDQDGYVRQRAATILGVIGGPRAVEALVAALDPGGAPMLANTREAIIDAIASIGDPRSVDPLLVAMKDEARQTRQAAARALVLIYQSGKMDRAQQAALLAQREAITTSHGDLNYGCPMEHSDGGIGVDFPV